jgi:hypothetical protein
VTSLTQGRRVSTMDRNLTPLDVHLPADIIKLAIDQHGPVVRLSCMEIASGINRLFTPRHTEGGYRSSSK